MKKNTTHNLLLNICRESFLIVSEKKRKEVKEKKFVHKSKAKQQNLQDSEKKKKGLWLSNRKKDFSDIE